MATARKAPGDFTGRQTEKLRKEASEKDADRAKQLSMATAEEKERIDNTIVDYSDPNRPVEEDAPAGAFDTYDVDTDDVVEVEQEGDSTPMVLIRLNADLKTNVGYRQEYEFEAGRRYRVPKHVADHLDEKGYVWH